MKGIIIDVCESTATVLERGGQLKKIKNRNYEVGQCVDPRFKLPKELCIAASCVLLLTVLVVASLVLYTTPTEFVYVHINPSLRLDVNRFGRVIGVVALNDDAAELLEKQELSRESAQSCIKDIVDACRALDFMPAEGGSVEFEVASKTDEISNGVEGIANELEEINCSVEIHSVRKKDNEEAIKNNISPKKLEAVREYTDAHGGVLEENIAIFRGMSVRDIRDLTRDEDCGKWDGLHGMSDTRIKAVKKYTEALGGTFEENVVLLKGRSIKDIYSMINAAEKNGSGNKGEKGKRK